MTVQDVIDELKRFDPNLTAKATVQARETLFTREIDTVSYVNDSRPFVNLTTCDE